MEKTPAGSSVGVDDPYAHVDRCDFVTGEGRCRWARDHGDRDPTFADRIAAQDFACPVVAEAEDPADADWSSCPKFRCREHDRSCARCGIEERRVAHEDERPLLEEHHLAYPEDDADEVGHEITVCLCRWCHAKVHDSWARIDDEASPDPEAIAEREGRRTRELDELSFTSANERFGTTAEGDHDD